MSNAVVVDRDDLNSTINSIIRAEAARRGVKMNTIAERVGFSYGGLHRRLTGVVAWNTTELEAVADLLGIGVRDLFADF